MLNFSCAAGSRENEATSSSLARLSRSGLPPVSSLASCRLLLFLFAFLLPVPHQARLPLIGSGAIQHSQERRLVRNDISSRFDQADLEDIVLCDWFCLCFQIRLGYGSLHHQAASSTSNYNVFTIHWFFLVAGRPCADRLCQVNIWSLMLFHYDSC